MFSYKCYVQVSSKETLSSLNDKSKLFENVGKCLHQSFELADACASILEAKLALKGYNPPNILSNESMKVAVLLFLVILYTCIYNKSLTSCL